MSRVRWVVGLALFAATACTAGVDGAGRPAADLYVPRTASVVPPPPATTGPPPTAPAPTGRPAPSRPGPAVPAVFGGSWHGRMVEPRGAVTSWSVLLALPAGSPVALFGRNTRCNGDAVVRAASARSLELLERVDYDPDDVCPDGGVITLTPAGRDRLRMRWVDPAHPADVATGVLSRGTG